MASWRLHPWKLLPCKGFQEEKTEGPGSVCTHEQAYTDALHDTWILSSHWRVWERTDRAGCSSPVPVSASGLPSFPCSKHPNAPWPFKTLQGGQVRVKTDTEVSRGKSLITVGGGAFCEPFQTLGCNKPSCWRWLSRCFVLSVKPTYLQDRGFCISFKHALAPHKISAQKILEARFCSLSVSLENPGLSEPSWNSSLLSFSQDLWLTEPLTVWKLQAPLKTFR